MSRLMGEGGISMAQETKCLTSGARFHIHVMSDDDIVKVEVELPKDTLWDVDAEEAEVMSKLIHNQLELVLRPYFEKRNIESGIFAETCMKTLNKVEYKTIN